MKSQPEAAVTADTLAPSRPGTAPAIRIAYRDGSGTFHADWPLDRVAEALDDRQGTLWVDIEDLRPAGGSGNGMGDGVEALFRDVFHFHPLAIEDALQETHVPKVDDWGDYLYIVFHTIDFQPDTDALRLHELDIFLGRNYLVTYHIERLPILNEHRRNIERDPATRCRHGADHLLYHLLDQSVAEFMPAIEHLDEAIDAAQDEVFRQPTPHTLRAIFRVKRAANHLYRVLAPQREVLNRLARDDYDPIKPDHRIYFRDVYDHVVRTHDITESLRDLISGALDTYLSAISNRTNDIMKTLTLVTVLFLPISFLTSFFGMNFFAENLSLRTTLPRVPLFWATVVIMLGSPLVMWIWARRRGWF